MSVVLRASICEKNTSSPIIPATSSVTRPSATTTGQLDSTAVFGFSLLNDPLLRNQIGVTESP